MIKEEKGSEGVLGDPPCVAIAIINGEQSISYKLPDHNSIYTAEYIALLEGVHLAIQLPDPTINICTDSLSALNNLKYNLHSSILAIKISNIIENANKNIRFIWTPGHSGIDGNEKADKAAREAVNNPLTEIRTYSSLIDIHRNVNTYCTSLWESEWRRTPNNMDILCAEKNLQYVKPAENLSQ
ncbi:uncharacterized protein LOC103309088 [Acyrthosiphon pisum]|uniref:RNase H type-1 domain-containing protein n=1 Tax=Acyrthosiphon pisum TaxID=7029 RepID=A0A8R2F8Y4_ACYPI|nr:uncharacterized protein LOC103309088 [Acyrthosiphon pisum]|eukprot:XP_008181901.1 PREDICTED: uncharacterized protein LOC103309088 [Acyrthosiphon pisum]